MVIRIKMTIIFNYYYDNNFITLSLSLSHTQYTHVCVWLLSFFMKLSYWFSSKNKDNCLFVLEILKLIAIHNPAVINSCWLWHDMCNFVHVLAFKLGILLKFSNVWKTRVTWIWSDLGSDLWDKIGLGIWIIIVIPWLYGILWLWCPKNILMIVDISVCF